ncbi:DedA family protein [Candidatus Micrarchaeota archaeon]|nr:DedA family protein [Candidatus Micrarchaeota archaeon]
MLFDVSQIILSFGYAALFAIIFAETGLLIGFFLPGDTLLFTAGILAAKGFVSLPAVIVICFAAAVIGDSFGYYLGKRFGKGIFLKNDPHFMDSYLNKENLEKTRSFFKKYGVKTIFFARYIPIVRTIAPTLAGTADMNYVSFLKYNVLGALAWVITVTLAGFFFGTVIPDALEIISVVVICIIIISVSAPFIYRRMRRKKQ